MFKGRIYNICYFLLLHRDEDMQSLASLMSLKQSDIGNLDDFNDSDEEGGEDRRANVGLGHAIPVTGEDLTAHACTSYFTQTHSVLRNY